MVIIRTRAMDVSIQAVSPEFGEQFSSTGGLAVPSQAGGAAVAAAPASGVGLAAGACAKEAFTNAKLSKTAISNPHAIAISRAPTVCSNFIGLLLSIEEGWSKRGAVGLAGADPHRLIEAEHEDLPVA